MPFFRPTEGLPAEPAAPVDPIPVSADENLRTPEETLERRLRLRRWLTLCLVVLLGFGGWFGAVPTVHALKAWQARRTAAQAERLMDSHQWFEAKGKVQDALQLWRQEPAALRAAALLLARTGNLREAAAFWKQIETVRPLTRDEEREDTGALLAAGDYAAAEIHLRKAWLDPKQGAPVDWELGMQLAVRQGHSPEAADLARRLLASPLASKRQRLTAAATLGSVGGPDTQEVAWDEIQAVARDPSSAESLDALLLLARRAAGAAARGVTVPATAAGAFPTLSELLARIDAHPLAKVQQHLLVLDLRLAQEPSQRAGIIQSAVDRFAGTKDNSDLAVLGAWLYGKGEFSRVLEVIPSARAVDDRALFFQRLDALGAQDRWSEIRESIQDHKIAIDSMVEQMYLARCADKLGETRVRDARWDAALAAAGDHPEKLIQVGEYAAKNGASDFAEKAFAKAIQVAPETREPYSAMVGLLQSLGNTARLRETLATMLARWPEDTAIRNDVAYMDALAGENLPAALAAARQLVRAEPASLPHRVTLALAELRSGNGLAALDAFAGIDMAHTAAPPRDRAVFAAVLWATSYNHEAVQAARGLPPESLLPEERALIQPVAGSAPTP